MENSYQEIRTSKGEFDKLRSDRRFAKLLNLARVVNAIYFCFHSLLEYSGDTTPAGQRQHLNAFFFSTGALYEGLVVADSLEKYFGDRESYQNGFGKFLNDPATQELRRTTLKRMRNKFVFHYDEDVAKKLLKLLDLKSYVFATNIGSKRKGTYYNLADEVAINYLVKDSVSKEEEDLTIRQAFKSIGDALSSYVVCADQLLGDVLSEGPWKIHDAPDAGL